MSVKSCPPAAGYTSIQRSGTRFAHTAPFWDVVDKDRRPPCDE